MNKAENFLHSKGITVDWSEETPVIALHADNLISLMEEYATLKQVACLERAAENARILIDNEKQAKVTFRDMKVFDSSEEKDLILVVDKDSITNKNNLI